MHLYYDTIQIPNTRIPNILEELAQQMRHVTDDHMTHQYLVQHVSVVKQRGNRAGSGG